MKVIIYISNYNFIGGVERFVENFCKRMNKHYDITLLFDNCQHSELLIEMSDYCNIEKLDKTKTYNCDYFICSTAWGQSPYDYIKATKSIQIIHADFRHVIANWNFSYTKHKNTTHHVCVGELVKTSFEIATPYKCDAIIYNLLDNMQKLKPKCKNKVLTFITVSRLSGEKGFDRMLKFAELLQLNKIEYIWDVYGNVNNDYNNNIVNKFAKTKVKFNGVIRNPMPLINQADYLVQLSDTEGFAYSVYEALQCKTPCIITPFASGNEQIQSGVNGYIVPFDLKDIDFKQIVNNIPTVKDFKEIGSEESWLNFLENGKENNSKSIKRVQR
jgi:glycosyltransferase involved in cell wall biosynthesis